MKGKSLVELAQELQHINNAKEDVIVSPSILHFTDDAKLKVNGGSMLLSPTNWTHQQISNYVDIPKAYYDRMLSNDKGLLKDNVNHWLNEKKPEDRRLLRTVDGTLRGFLSSRYRVIDSYTLMNVIFPILKEKGFEICSCELTEKRLYVKAVLPKVSAEIKVGDVVQFGVLITNSEVGAGMFRIEPFLLRLVCLNGAVTDAAIRKYHVGRDQGTEEMMEVLSDEALNASDEALMLQVRDVLLASSDPTKLFAKQVELMRDAAVTPIKNFDLIEVVKKATIKVGIHSKFIRENIVAELANGNQGAGMTKWGLVNSFTAAAKLQNVGYDESVDLERAGGQILTLSSNEWNTIAG